MSVHLSRRSVLSLAAALPVLAHAQSRPAPPRELLALAGQCVLTGWHGRGVPRAVESLASMGALGAVLLASHNYADRAQLQRMTTLLRGLGPRNARPLVTVDQEGGAVSHLSPPLTRMPSMTALGNVDDLDLTHRAGAAIGHELRAVGVDVDLAPVLDARTNPRNTVVLGRVFSREPERVARHGVAFIDGLWSAKVLASAKHFPGHGDTAVDSHAGLPRVPHNLARLEQVELVPFRAALPSVASVMVGHIVFAGIDPYNPATLSPAIVDGILRQRLQYDGVAMTDDLQMTAIRRTHGHVRAVELAIRAGCDLAMLAHNAEFARQAIEHLARLAETDAVLRRRITESAARVGRMRAKLDSVTPPNPYVVDAERLRTEIESRRAGLNFRSASAHHDPTIPH
ncbi:MAG: glycoside hydrolase family 3 N-terminal domain-containing protein [Deltaproteobacteria bacterium]|nr:glycoside hydrolase family 3 N-terminal domain-containing protein [Deltaproteobacteria bacterium]